MTKPKHSLEKLIAERKYYYVNRDITETNFPVPETIETEGAQIIKLDKTYNSQECLDLIKSKGLRPANIYELAIYANEHPEAWTKNKYTGKIAFGSQFTDSDGFHRVSYVRRASDGDWGFSLGDFGGDWGDDGCLLCFCDQNFDSQSLSPALETSDSLSDAIRIVKEAGYTIYKKV
jgi:hypothetical protein